LQDLFSLMDLSLEWALAGIGLAGPTFAILQHNQLAFTLLLFAIGVVAAVITRRYTEFNEHVLEDASMLSRDIPPGKPGWAWCEDVTAFAFAATFVFFATLLRPGLGAAAGGLVAGQAAVELRFAHWLRCWERKRGFRLFADVPRFLFYRRDALPEVYRQGFPRATATIAAEAAKA